VSSRDVRDVNVTDLFDVFRKSGDDVPFRDLLMVEVVEKFYIRQIDHVDDGETPVPGREIVARVVDSGVQRFDNERDADGFRGWRDPREDFDNVRVLGFAVEVVLVRYSVSTADQPTISDAGEVSPSSFPTARSGITI